jgi:hypothetical protein
LRVPASRQGTSCLAGGGSHPARRSRPSSDIETESVAVDAVRVPGPELEHGQADGTHHYHSGRAGQAPLKHPELLAHLLPS